MTEPTPGRIFINYRRDDTAREADKLFKKLADRFGPHRVFMDSHSLRPGDEFFKVIDDKAGSCDVLLALIGKRWLDITDKQGQRRLPQEDDYVRREIATALARKVRVVPILVDVERMPSAKELPSSLAGPPDRHAPTLSKDRFDFDASQLCTALEETLAEEQARPAAKPREHLSTRGRILTTLGGGVVLISLLIVTIVWTPHSPTTPPPAGAVPGASPPSSAVIFHDDFSSRTSGWNDDGSKRTGGHYSNGAYHVHAEPWPAAAVVWRQYPRKRAAYTRQPLQTSVSRSMRAPGGQIRTPDMASSVMYTS